MSKQIKKAASVAAKSIKGLSNPSKSQIEKIYREFQATTDEYSHMP